MKTINYIVTGMVILALASACAKVQYRKGARAQAYLEYSEAVGHYERAVARKPIDSAYLGLGESYYWMNNPEKSVQWYDSAANYMELPGEHQLYYAEGLRNLERYDSARTVINGYLAQNSGDKRAQNFRSSLDRVLDMKKDSMEFIVSPVEGLKLGSRSAFSPTPYDDGMVITAEWGEDRMANDYEWTGKPFLDLVYVQMDTTGEIIRVNPLDDDINTKYHEGPAVFTADRNTVYFSRSDSENGNQRRRHINTNWRTSSTKTDKIVNVKLYQATRNGRDWKDVKATDLNMDGYSTGHPALSNDGNTLYFVSDRPGGRGRADIWKAKRQSNGMWGRPENLQAINTEGNEMFPTVVTDGDGNEMLVFSSDGHGGLGGLDLYSVPVGNERLPEHLDYPLNSSFDDFGMMATNMYRGYFSTNRATPGNEVDQIYMFERRPQIHLRVTVEDARDRAPVEGATVTLFSSTGTGTETFQTNNSGEVITEIKPEGQYTITAEKPGFASTTELVNVADRRRPRMLSDTIGVTMTMGPERPVATTEGPPTTRPPATTPKLKQPKPTQELRRDMAANNIYYDFDRWNIRPDAARQLDSIAMYMKEQSRMTIELAGHADCRGSDAYNMELSRKRAQSAADYLTRKGVSRNRMMTEASGERELVNNCDCSEDAWGTSCTAAQHQANRRTEIKVTRLSEAKEGGSPEASTGGNDRDVSEAVGADPE